jgi:heptosyltransferase-3
VDEVAIPAPRRILVINVTRIGDTLLVTPAMRALAARWPQARIDFLGHPNRYEIIRHLPFVASVGAVTKRTALFKGWLGARWDLCVVYGFDRPLVCYALRAGRGVVAFRQGEPSIDRRLLRCVEPPAYQVDHAVRMQLLLTRALGVPDAGLRLSYVVTAEERSAARATLARMGVAHDTPLVGLQLKSFHTKAWRDWPVSHFTALCKRIAARWPRSHFVILGGADDRERAAQFIAELPRQSSSLAGALSLRQSAAVMSQLDLFVGIDSGPAHIMGALEAPMVVLYHCTSPSRLIAPLERPRCHAVDHPRPAPCSPDVDMAELPVDTVWARVVEALDGR